MPDEIWRDNQKEEVCVGQYYLTGEKELRRDGLQKEGYRRGKASMGG